MFDAYTVKKVLPRLVAAVILINLSWFIFTSMISLTNIVSYGLEAIIAAPFGGTTGGNALINDPLSSAMAAADLGNGAYFTTLAGMAAVGYLLAASVGIFAVVSIVVGFLVLAIRRILLIVLILIAPIALVAWILPGTQKFWKMWWDNFTKLLLMFPLIVIMVTAGAALARVVAAAGSDSTGSEPVTVVLIFACVFAPFFLIPKTYNLAGAGLGLAAGWIAGQASKGGDWAEGVRKKRRADAWKGRAERASTGNAFKGGNRDNLRGRLNRGIQTASLLGAGGATLSMNKRRDRMESARGSRNYDTASQFMKENQAFAAIANDDDKLWAVMQGGSEEQIRSNLIKKAPGRFSDPAEVNAAIADIMRVRRDGGDQIARIAATRAQAGTGTGFDTSGQLLQSINAAAGADRTTAGRMLGEMRGAASQSGRIDLGGAGFADMAQNMDSLRAGTVSAADATAALSEKVIMAHGGGALLSGKKQAVEALAPSMLKRLDKAVKSGSPVDVNRELASIAGRYDAMAQIAPQNAAVMADKVLGETAYFDEAGRSVTVRQMMENQRGNAEFLNMRREYASASTAAAAAAAGGGAPATPPPPAGGGGGTP